MPARWKCNLVSSVVNHIKEMSRGLADSDIHRSTDFSVEVSGKGTTCDVVLMR